MRFIWRLPLRLEKKQRPLPGRFELVGERRDLRDVVRNRKFATANPRKYLHISCSREIRTGESPTADLQLDPEQRVKDVRPVLPFRNVERA